MTVGSVIFAIKEIPADHDAQIRHLRPTLIRIGHFMGNKLWLYKISLAQSVECSPMVWETRVQSLVTSYKRLKIIHDTSLFNTKQYKVRIKSNVKQSRESNSALLYTTV